MKDYNDIIRILKDSVDKMNKATNQVYTIITCLEALQAVEDEQANQMGKHYWEEFEKGTGTLRSTINDLDKLTGGELKSTWKQK